jgi:hypothetical protein
MGAPINKMPAMTIVEMIFFIFSSLNYQPSLFYLAKRNPLINLNSACVNTTMSFFSSFLNIIASTRVGVFTSWIFRVKFSRLKIQSGRKETGNTRDLPPRHPCTMPVDFFFGYEVVCGLRMSP